MCAYCMSDNSCKKKNKGIDSFLNIVALVVVGEEMLQLLFYFGFVLVRAMYLWYITALYVARA